MKLTCKTCSVNFNKKLTLRQKFDNAIPKFCSEDCAKAYATTVNLKLQRANSKRPIPKSSKEEINFGALIRTYFPSLQSQYKIKDYGHHYDFYLPEIKLLIEYNGTYWHNKPKVRAKDREHLKAATAAKVSLAVITDKEWKMFIESGLPDKQKLLNLLSTVTKNRIN